MPEHPNAGQEATRDHAQSGPETTQQWRPGDDTSEASLADADLAYSVDQQLSALELYQTPPPPVHPELVGLQPLIHQLHGLAQVLSSVSSSSARPGTDERSTTSAVATKIGKYDVVRRLGQGGQASAYLAFDPDLHRHVVIKFYRDVQTPQEQDAVLAEGRSLARVRSPYVAQVHAAERHEGIPYLVVEYVPGKNLHDLMQTEPIGLDRALAIVGKLAEGLMAVHACGLLHRDLKPSNVMIGDDGVPRLVDFGLATAFGAEALRRISGTLAYMAPEQARGESERIDPRSDVYGLGAVLYALLTGGPPHQGATRDALWQSAKEGEIVPPRQRKANVPTAVEALVLKSLAKDPGQRYDSARELAEALKGLQTRRLWIGQISERARRQPVHFAVGTLAAAVLILTTVVFVTPWWRQPGDDLVVAHLPTGLPYSTPTARTPQFEPASPAPPAPTAPTTPVVNDPPAAFYLGGHKLRADFRLEVEPQGGRKDETGVIQLVENDVLTFRVLANRNCYLALCAVDEAGTITRLFPNRNERDHFLKANEPRVVPNVKLATVRATLSTGKEYVYAIAATQPWELVDGQNVDGAFAAFFSREEKDRIRGEFDRVRGLKLELAPQTPADQAGGVAEVVVPFFVKAKPPTP